jgi:TRAP-type C4-dicarboxylate transport system permease small subunit
MTSRGRIHSLFEGLRIVQLWLAAVALIVMMSVTVADVFLRYVFNKPVRGSYEMVEAMLVIFVFHGMSTAFLHRKNITIDLIDTFARARLVAFLVRLSDVLSIATVLLFTYAMIVPAMQSYAYGEVKLELQLPIYWYWVAALAGMAGTIVCAIGALLASPEPSVSHDEGPVA